MILHIKRMTAAAEYSVWLKLAFIFLMYTDGVLTIAAVQLGMSEMNPFMVHLLEHPIQLALTKFAAPLLIALALPGRFLLPSVAFMLCVTAWNAAQLTIGLP